MDGKSGRHLNKCFYICFFLVDLFCCGHENIDYWLYYIIKLIHNQTQSNCKKLLYILESAQGLHDNKVLTPV